MTLLNISSLSSYVFCKRLFYYREIEQVEAENYYMVDGEQKHAHVDGDGWQIRTEGDKTFGLTLQSDRLGLSGRFDVLEEKGWRYIPVEYKRGEAGDWLNHRVQVCAQAMLLEDYFGEPVPEGYIYYYGSKKRLIVECDTNLRDLTLQAMQEASQMIADPRSPEAHFSAHCQGCSLYEHCLPAEVEQLQQKKQGKQKRILTQLDEREILYITTSDVSITKHSNRLVIKEEEAVVHEIPLIKVRKVVLFGSINLSHPVISLLLKNNIEIVYANYYGKYEGTLIPPENRNGLLRKKQILATEQDNICAYLSRQFIEGKIHNMRVLLQRRNREEHSEEIAGSVQQLKAISKQLGKVDTVDSLRGEEGLATKIYFQSLDRLLAADVNFAKRNRRPPQDPVNALLSLGYSLLTKDVEGCCRLVGFDPYSGFLHKDRYGKPSLALDLMEEFRPLIVDQVVLYVLNSGIVQEEDFEVDGQVRLTQPGLKKFLAQYEQRKKTELAHPVFGYQTTYQRAIEIQARMLAKYLTGELDEYIPLKIR